MCFCLWGRGGVFVNETSFLLLLVTSWPTHLTTKPKHQTMWSCNRSLKVSIGCRMVFRSGGAFKSLPNIPLTGFLAVSQVDSAIFGVMVSCFPPFADSFSFQLSFFTTGWCTYLRTTTHRDNFAIYLRAMATWYYPISLNRQSLVATFSIRSIPCR